MKKINIVAVVCPTYYCPEGDPASAQNCVSIDFSKTLATGSDAINKSLPASPDERKNCDVTLTLLRPDNELIDKISRMLTSAGASLARLTSLKDKFYKKDKNLWGEAYDQFESGETISSTQKALGIGKLSVETIRTSELIKRSELSTIIEKVSVMYNDSTSSFRTCSMIDPTTRQTATIEDALKEYHQTWLGKNKHINIWWEIWSTYHLLIQNLAIARLNSRQCDNKMLLAHDWSENPWTVQEFFREAKKYTEFFNIQDENLPQQGQDTADDALKDIGNFLFKRECEEEILDEENHQVRLLDVQVSTEKEHKTTKASTDFVKTLQTLRQSHSHNPETKKSLAQTIVQKLESTVRTLESKQIKAQLERFSKKLTKSGSDEKSVAIWHDFFTPHKTMGMQPEKTKLKKKAPPKAWSKIKNAVKKAVEEQSPDKLTPPLEEILKRNGDPLLQDLFLNLVKTTRQGGVPAYVSHTLSLYANKCVSDFSKAAKKLIQTSSTSKFFIPGYAQAIEIVLEDRETDEKLSALVLQKQLVNFSVKELDSLFDRTSAAPKVLNREKQTLQSSREGQDIQAACATATNSLSDYVRSFRSFFGGGA